MSSLLLLFARLFAGVQYPPNRASMSLFFIHIGASDQTTPPLRLSVSSLLCWLFVRAPGVGVACCGRMGSCVLAGGLKEGAKGLNSNKNSRERHRSSARIERGPLSSFVQAQQTRPSAVVLEKAREVMRGRRPRISRCPRWLWRPLILSTTKGRPDLEKKSRKAMILSQQLKKRSYWITSVAKKTLSPNFLQRILVRRSLKISRHSAALLSAGSRTFRQRL